MTKSGPAQVLRGQQLVFNIVVNNLGPDTAVNTRLLDPTPAGLQFVSTSRACTGGFPCALGDLPNGATRTLMATYLVPVDYAGPDMIINIVTALSDSQDPTPGNTTSSSSVPVAPGQAAVFAPRIIPVDARWAMLLLAALMASMAAMRLGRSD